LQLERDNCTEFSKNNVPRISSTVGSEKDDAKVNLATGPDGPFDTAGVWIPHGFDPWAAACSGAVRFTKEEKKGEMNFEKNPWTNYRSDEKVPRTSGSVVEASSSGKKGTPSKWVDVNDSSDSTRDDGVLPTAPDYLKYGMSLCKVEELDDASISNANFIASMVGRSVKYMCNSIERDMLAQILATVTEAREGTTMLAEDLAAERMRHA